MTTETTRIVLDLTQTAIRAGEHGDTDGARTLTLLDRHIRDGVWRTRRTPVQAGALASKIEGGRVEVSPAGEPVVSYGSGVGNWVTLDASEVDGE